MSQSPLVSIILPTYNREKFLPEAFQAIQDQAFTDWELIIVDDGSTDNTKELIPELTKDFTQPVQYIYQENQGAYGARNTGLDHTSGKYIAFYDSDDLWLPHHLKDCVDGLEANPDVDWVYGACRMVNYETGEEIAPSTFYVDGKPRPFMKYFSQRNNSLLIFSNKRFRKKILFQHAPYCGFQNSVLRAKIFSNSKFETVYKNEAEDSLFLIRHIIGGRNIACINNVHVEYQVHESHSSAAGELNNSKKRLILDASIQAYKNFHIQNKKYLSVSEQILFRRMLSKIVFWNFAYSTLTSPKDRMARLRAMWSGIKIWPFNILYWKSFFASALKR